MSTQKKAFAAGDSYEVLRGNKFGRQGGSGPLPKPDAAVE